jgi:hypothetical protein
MQSPYAFNRDMLLSGILVSSYRWKNIIKRANSIFGIKQPRHKKTDLKLGSFNPLYLLLLL